MDLFSIENEPNQEFSYPAAIQTEDGIIHITYTHYRKTIRYCYFDGAWIDSQLEKKKLIIFGLI